ncbi:MAG: 4Fe-4S dicluster domain-containing protein, partial [Desulfohalobiaceae bacterium]|nr:4Fe-4S dicluster domain-containing protein [Desulfohalobiaceae bacterium]
MAKTLSRNGPGRERDIEHPEGIRPGEELSFSSELREATRTEFRHCLQCLSCSGGCPFVQAMDLGPSRVMRFLQLGLEDLALENSTIWICVGCHTCDG